MSVFEDNVSSLERYISGLGGHDLEVDDLGPVEIPSWEGFPVRMWSYSKTDNDGTTKPGTAAMLNPSANQVARWIVSAVSKSSGAYNGKFAQKLASETNDASGFQFLVRGVHLEMMTPPAHKAYPFFDGVTVKLDTIPDGYPTRPLSQSELTSTIEATAANVTKVGVYARIQSTTADEYHSAGGTEDTDGINWPNVVRQLYQDAWGNDEYFLMTATAVAKKAEWGF